ncbi:MAG: class I SAM-dependent methyltransferase [Bacteroidetes bacterium]|nr:class I SAM-dependent methyltransferase [Bacteroidota bacterium]
MSWYDTFSGFYDLTVEPHYKEARKIGVDKLNLKEGDVVLDLACGTGPNLKHLSPLVGKTGLVIGLDYSKGMINKAKKKVAENNWENVILIQEDAREISKDQIAKYCGREIHFDNVISVLGLSVIPEHEEVFENTYALLKPGGNYVIIDIYADKFVPTSWWTKLLSRADLKRKSWEFLEKKTSDFSLNNISKNRHLHGGLLYIASGKKKNE